MGKLLSEILVKKLSEQTKVNFKVFTTEKKPTQATHREAIRSLTPNSKFYIDEISDNELRIYTALLDIENRRKLFIYADIERDISREGRQSLQYSFLIGISAAGVMFLIILLVMQKVVVAPLRQLTLHISSIKNSDKISTLPSFERQDELGTLQEEFNNMMTQLDQTRRKLLEQSYYSGMADMMAGLLHNIRNSLSPIKGHAALLRSDIAKAPLQNIQHVKDELTTNSASVDRKNDLLQYLLLMVETCAGIFGKAEQKLVKISTSVNRIETVLKDHQKWAHAERPLESVKIESFLSEIIDQVRHSIPDNIQIILNLDGCSEESVRIHVSLLKQIFSKILFNASDSIKQSQIHQGEIRIVAATTNIAESSMMHYKFYDNGEGIPADSLKMIFERGFTTKNTGISGIGLHWCANTINSMQGKIYAESEGLGKGACFHVILPLNTDLIG